MNKQTGGYAPQSAASVGATYYPGSGGDDYDLPLISPLPQRAHHEVPEQIQENLAHLDLDAGSPASRTSSMANNRQFLQGGHFDYNTLGSYNAGEPADYPQHAQGALPPRTSSRQAQPAPVPEDEPTFSAFPQLKSRPPNVPSTDEERESTLERARETVINSNDPERQVAWAQDALTYVDVAVQNEARLAETRSGRPKSPRVEHQLRVDAINIVSFLADQHHPKAEFLRGMWLEFGKFGFEEDKREAYRCYSRSSANGYARAEYRMGMQFESSNEVEKATKHYNLGIQQHDAASHYRMGMMSLLGQYGQPQDMGRGLELIRFSAEHADENAPQGAYVYGMLFARELPQVTVPDTFIAMDLEQARYFIEKAAYLGFAKAQVRMAAAFELCQLSCDFDPVLSLHYNNLAARQGEPEAEMAISKWFLSGCEGIFQKNESMAFAYAQRAALSGLPTAEFAMGYYYEVGIHVPVNIKEAKVWYGKAAENGNKDAAGRIDGISRSKTLSRKDHEKIAMERIKSTRGTRPNKSRPERFSQNNQQDRDAGRPESTAVMPTMPEISGPMNPPVQHGGEPPLSMPMGPEPSSYGPPDPRYGRVSPSSGFRTNTYSAPPQAASPYSSPSLNPSQGYPQYPSQRAPRTPVGGPGRGRGGYYPTGPTGQPNPQSYYRGPSPGPLQPQQSASPYPQGYRVSSSGYPPQSGPHQPAVPPKPKPVGADFGFNAPPDFGRRPHAPDRADTARPGSAAPPPGGALAPSQRPGPQHANTFAGPVPSPGSQQIGGRPPRGDSMPIGGPPQAGGNAPTPPPASTGASRPAQPPIRRTGKGPATFEEMGVPPTKKEEDCIIM